MGFVSFYSYIRLFEFNEAGAIYDFSAYYGAPENEWFYDDNVYSTYENAIEAAMSSGPPDDADFSTVARPVFFRIRRRLADLELGSDYLYFTSDFDYYKISPETSMTDDDFETIRIHLNAYKERLCNQRRWKEAEEYQRIIDRFMAFASAQPEQRKGKWIIEGTELRRRLRCSCCSSLAIWAPYAMSFIAPNFCPNCGADLREVTE